MFAESLAFSLIFLHDRSEFAVSLSHPAYRLNFPHAFLTFMLLSVCFSLRMPDPYLTLIYVFYIPLSIYLYVRRRGRSVEDYYRMAGAFLERFTRTGSWDAADSYYTLEDDYLRFVSGDWHRFYMWHCAAAVGVSSCVIMQQLAMRISGSPISLLDLAALTAFTLYLPAVYYLWRSPAGLWLSRVKASYRGVLRMSRPPGWRRHGWKPEYWRKVV